MKQITVAIVGLGSRGYDTYACSQHKFPEEMKIVAGADPKPERLNKFKKEFNVPEENCFATADELLSKPKLADVLFICTMDRQHYKEAIRAMELGYDILLEKPISPDLHECKEIARVANKLGRKVVVCHVLRYTPFYQTVKAKIDSGVIGDVVCIQAIEQVGYWHQCHSFVRGNWHNTAASSPMILQKSCHDMDILSWLAGSDCLSLSSIGGLKEFREEMAPEGSTERCVDCSLNDTCPYSAVKYYCSRVENGETGWPASIVCEHPTVEKIMENLRTGPYGMCVYHNDNDVVDHQMVQMTMKNGININFIMTAFNNGGRDLRIFGTRGFMEGKMEEGELTVHVFDGLGGSVDENINIFELADDFSGHGGGDVRLVRDILQIAAGEKDVSGSLTSIDKSIESHFMAMACEKSRLEGGTLINIDEFMKLYE